MEKQTKKQPKPLEPWQIQDALRLRSLFKIKAGMSQLKFGSEFDIGNQSMVFQYLTAKRPLNIDVAKKFATGLQCKIDEFSPTLADKIASASERIEQLDHDADHAPVQLIDAKASAGHGSIVFSTDETKHLMFRRDFLLKNSAKPEDVIAFPVTGKSMVDMHIIDKSVVIANKKKKEPINKRIYVLWIDGELFVKQLIQKDGSWFARSHNKEHADEYPDIQIDIDDRIVGRVFWCGFSI